MPCCPISLQTKENVLTLLRVGDLLLREKLYVVQNKPLSPQGIRDVLVITRRITEITFVVPDNQHVVMSDAVKGVMHVITEGGKQWPLLHRVKYLTEGLNLTALDFNKVLLEVTPGYKASTEDQKIASPEMREWFTFKLQTLDREYQTERQMFIPHQLEITTPLLEQQIIQMDRTQNNMQGMWTAVHSYYKELDNCTCSTSSL
ncbi:uncharacterized protein PHACADRAFT_23811 [Phanerochaete carnosa HHB-10118-sp]|uniref:Uncharacterized protein n=1 Tax=Phanerochaete carnosa (strain HHB-10118-sp) TaxID=650164 RepID=K5WM38_PHACS|nr:uncharacterized protein PHACADRAFT_23811 [Phanerochaete carnosa HHB-10118-sp]EKM60500.1 hypothetical protein PHACADRAFT_23811 [Phanerochaete carnosa HHB-10118-sp]